MSEPLPVIERRGWRLVLGLARRYRGMLAWISIASLFGALIEASFLVVLTGALLAVAEGGADDLTVFGRDVPVNTALTVGAGAVVLRLALNVAAVRTSAALAARVTRDERHRLSHAYLQADWALQQSQPAGRLQELLTSFVGRINSSMIAFAQGLTAGLSLIAFLSTGIAVDAVATTAILLALIALGAVLSPIRKVIRRRADTATTSSLHFATRVAEFGALGLEMQTFGATRAMTERIDELTTYTTESHRRMQVLNGALSPLYTFLAYLSILGATAYLMTQGSTNLASIGAVMLLMLRSLSYGQQLMTVIGNLVSFLPSLEGVEAAVAEYRAAPADSGVLVPESPLPLNFERVSFEYTPGVPALNEIDFTLQPGEMLGVIGPSGAGKSTLAQLVLGLRRPNSGRITGGHADLTEVDRTWWTHQTAFVPQDPVLLTGTVAENLRFMREQLSHDDLVRAASQANILEEILRLPDGFSTHLGERGSALSGGQRQRLSIARALVGQPSLIVLDEPTSALDSRSELLIRTTLQDLKRSIGVVIIAHRMSTVDLCDRIMVIQDGRVTALDEPARLASTNAFYRAAIAAAAPS